MTTFQRTSLIVARTLIGWHFLYEGYYKLMVPGWTRAGHPIAAWSAAGYFSAATGPFAGPLHRVAASGAIHWLDLAVPIFLIAVGLSLMLGLFTQAGCWGAIGFLTAVYLSAPPLAGAPQAGAEGTYLIVNKNLVELAALLILLAFPTGAIAGLDRLRYGANARERVDVRIC